MSNQIDTVFSRLELECAECKLMEKIKKLEQENALLKEKEVSRTKFNMEAECVCVVFGKSTRIYGEVETLDKLLSNCTGLKYTRSVCVEWGPIATLNSTSIATAKNFLLKIGYVYSHETTIDGYKLENWVRGI